MTNMSYCRWQNTLSDLHDYAADIHDNLDKSPDEKRARERLFELAVTMLEEIGVAVELTAPLEKLIKDAEYDDKEDEE